MGKHSSGKWYFDIWSDGKYVDLWSVNHTLAGCVIAGPLYALSVSFLYSLIIAFVLIIAWEGYEIVSGIKETWQNTVVDIITGLIGFFFLWELNLHWASNDRFWIYISLLAIWLALEVWGYIAFQVTKG